MRCGSREQQAPHWPGEDNWLEGVWGKCDSDVWKWPWQPRVCSWCGSAHPEDAIKLLQEKWEVEGTGKAYKRYIHPPGYHEFIANLNARCRELAERGVDPMKALKEDRVIWHPTPPVKLYGWHLDEQTMNRFNELVKDYT